MKCKDCNVIGCPNRGSNAVFNKPCTIINLNSFDWESFRNQTAKDILCSIIQGGYAESRIEHQSKLAVKYTDELIKQLKEKE